MKYDKMPGVYDQAILRFRLKREPVRNVFLHANENVYNFVKKRQNTGVKGLN